MTDPAPAGTDTHRDHDVAAGPLPWHVVETLPTAEAETIRRWDDALAEARRRDDDHAAVRAATGAALSRYWAHQLLGRGATWHEVERERDRLTDDAVSTARRLGDRDLLVEALLGRLHACWGPDHDVRDRVVDELLAMRGADTPADLRLRIDEWEVLDRFDRSDLAAAEQLVDDFERRHGAGADGPLAQRRAALWRANLAMLRGDLDDAVARNERAVSDTADLAGSPAAFQNVAVTRSIERYLRGGLGDVIEAVRSIRASAVRVGSNWDVALAFTLAETGALDESRSVLHEVARDDFAAVVPDLSWLVTMHLVGLTVVHLGDRALAEQVLARLEPHGDVDGTHGMGYASYGPTARVLGQLCATLGRHGAAAQWFDRVIDGPADGPWVALTRLDRAALRLDPERRVEQVRRAQLDVARWSMGRWQQVAAARRVDVLLDGDGGPAAIRRGERWTLVHPSGSATLPAGPAAELLLTLLRSPGHDWAAIELEGSPGQLPSTATIEPHLDDDAVAAYRDRLRELGSVAPEELDDDTRREVEMLRSELGAARFASSASVELERARVRITTSLRRSIGRVGEQSPSLANHLRASLSTGRRCMYAPSDGETWTIVS